MQKHILLPDAAKTHVPLACTVGTNELGRTDCTYGANAGGLGRGLVCAAVDRRFAPFRT